jgi:indole-3-glycerol phosphate synthase
VGINNRNLATFDTDIGTAMAMARQLAPGQIPVAASGITGREDVQANVARGVFNFLIGESLVRSDDPAAKLAGMLPQPPLQGNDR